MTTVTDATLFDLPTKPVDADVASLLALIAGDPIHERDREVIVQAIVDTAREGGGLVDPNALRAKLADSSVFPNLLGAVTRSLSTHGVLSFVGFCETTGSKSGNNNKAGRVWRLRAVPS